MACVVLQWIRATLGRLQRARAVQGIGRREQMVTEASHCMAGGHDIGSATMAPRNEPIVVKSGTWIASRAFVGPGVTIGEDVVIAGGAVVIRDVEPGVIVAGNPAKVVRERSNVDVKATQNASVKGLQTTIEGSVKAELKGATANVTGEAMAEIKAALVKIN